MCIDTNEVKSYCKHNDQENCSNNESGKELDVGTYAAPNGDGRQLFCTGTVPVPVCVVGL